MRLRALTFAAITTAFLHGPLFARPAAATPVSTCMADCDASQDVTVDELLNLISVALGAPLNECVGSADLDDNGEITVDEVLTALNQALLGCFDPRSCDNPALAESEPLCALDQATVKCDFLVPEHCMLPYPSSVFLAAESSTPTGYRVDIPRAAMPANSRGVHIDPAEFDSYDGFSPGSVLVAYFPEGVHLAASNVAPLTNFPRSLEADSPTVLLDATTGERVPHMVEREEQAQDPSKRVLYMRPGVRLHETHRYIVAIRNLIAEDGVTPVEPRPAFRILRDNLETPVRAINDRRPQMEEIFDKLTDAGVERGNLLLAWDFVVASTEALTGRMLALRDQGLEANGDGAPPWRITQIEEFTPEQDGNILRRVRGKFTVPLFMTSATPPAHYNLDENGVPRQNGTAEYDFTVNIPRSTVADGVAHPARPSLYGHGLFGSRDEVNAGHLRDFSNRVNIMFGATDWIGMSDPDVRYVTRMIPDLSGFNILVDRLQQAMLNQMLLGRLFLAEDGFVSDPAFQLDGQPLIDRQELYYYGLSQGGIAGAMYMALATDHTRGVLGVGASNYSFLLQRSRDFTPFQAVLNLNYFNEFDRALLYPMLQQLWDRGEPLGYQSHLVSDPLPGTPAKKVLLQVGLDDSQVSPYAAEIQARSLGLPTVAPAVRPIFGIEEVEAPFDGSAFIEYDVGGEMAPLTNTPPRCENGVHEAVRRLRVVQDQIDAFLRPDGMVVSFCDGPCRLENVPNVNNECQ